MRAAAFTYLHTSDAADMHYMSWACCVGQQGHILSIAASWHPLQSMPADSLASDIHDLPVNIMSVSACAWRLVLHAQASQAERESITAYAINRGQRAASVPGARMPMQNPRRRLDLQQVLASW